jgi:glutamate dehydrogenase (NADP+)
MMKKLSNRADCVFTGKGLSLRRLADPPRGHRLRHGVLRQEMLKQQAPVFDGKRVSRVGLGQRGAVRGRKGHGLGAKVVTVSDSSGTVSTRTASRPKSWPILMEVKNHLYGRVSDYAQPGRIPGRQAPWHMPVDVALPCATQNELDATTPHAGQERRALRGRRRQHALHARSREAFEAAGVLYAPGKASNAGGVATSGLEMSQNAMRLSWPAKKSTPACTASCRHPRRLPAATAARRRQVSYVDGANIAGFVKVADAMLAQGVT